MKANTIEAMIEHEGSPHFKQLMLTVIALSWPAIVEQLMLTMVQYVDTAMVGSLGPNSTAAVGISASTTWLFIGLINAVSIGFSVQVAQYVGGKQHQLARGVVTQAIKFGSIFGIVLGIIGMAIAFPLPSLLGADVLIHKDATTYFFIYSMGLPFVLFSALLGALIRCSGDTKTPMLLNILINIINIILNFLFIYPVRDITFVGVTFKMWGAGLGVAGAAIGSAVSLMLVSMLMLLVLYKKQSPIQITKGEKQKFDPICINTAFQIGLPVALERTTLCIAQIIMTGMISGLGTVAIASNHLGITAESLCYMPGFGVAIAATTMVGQALGANRKELAIRFANTITAMGIGLMVIVAVLLFAFSPNLIRFFTDDPEVIAMGTVLLRIVAVSEPFFGSTVTVTGVLRGAGDSKSAFYINFCTMWLFRIILAFFLKDYFGLAGVWIAMSAHQILTGLIFGWKLLSKKWANTKIIYAKKA